MATAYIRRQGWKIQIYVREKSVYGKCGVVAAVEPAAYCGLYMIWKLNKKWRNEIL